MLVGVRCSDVGAFAPFICDRYGMQADVFVGKRDPVIDVVRGIAIALVVLGHVTDLPSLAHKFI